MRGAVFEFLTERALTRQEVLRSRLGASLALGLLEGRDGAVHHLVASVDQEALCGTLDVVVVADVSGLAFRVTLEAEEVLCRRRWHLPLCRVRLTRLREGGQVATYGLRGLGHADGTLAIGRSLQLQLFFRSPVAH